ncbi:hypothetical protein TSOC_002862 [Tetrabaena socialis]|uniref:Uncharacterized protein n=1 Tax=Tetrabaena socialis TaxID=47790 RepID=A0A2J8AD05_9CHLO|nr:hypothetical protein TSOC_002862 [Tetrabaena socialis]|eukprot:PNH10397.1 hypothetical protein TSOC_002862 [Tetrabaena socialis]
MSGRSASGLLDEVAAAQQYALDLQVLFYSLKTVATQPRHAEEPAADPGEAAPRARGAGARGGPAQQPAAHSATSAALQQHIDDLAQQLDVERREKAQLQQQYQQVTGMLRKSYGRIVDDYLHATEQLHARTKQLEGLMGSTAGAQAPAVGQDGGAGIGGQTAAGEPVSSLQLPEQQHGLPSAPDTLPLDLLGERVPGRAAMRKQVAEPKLPTAADVAGGRSGSSYRGDSSSRSSAGGVLDASARTSGGASASYVGGANAGARRDSSSGGSGSGRVAAARGRTTEPRPASGLVQTSLSYTEQTRQGAWPVQAGPEKKATPTQSSAQRVGQRGMGQQRQLEERAGLEVHEGAGINGWAPEAPLACAPGRLASLPTDRDADHTAAAGAAAASSLFARLLLSPLSGRECDSLAASSAASSPPLNYPPSVTSTHSPFAAATCQRSSDCLPDMPPALSRPLDQQPRMPAAAPPLLSSDDESPARQSAPFRGTAHRVRGVEAAADTVGAAAATRRAARLDGDGSELADRQPLMGADAGGVPVAGVENLSAGRCAQATARAAAVRAAAAAAVPRDTLSEAPTWGQGPGGSASTCGSKRSFGAVGWERSPATLPAEKAAVRSSGARAGAAPAGDDGTVASCSAGGAAAGGGAKFRRSASSPVPSAGNPASLPQRHSTSATTRPVPPAEPPNGPAAWAPTHAAGGAGGGTPLGARGGRSLRYANWPAADTCPVVEIPTAAQPQEPGSSAVDPVAAFAGPASFGRRRSGGGDGGHAQAGSGYTAAAAGPRGRDPAAPAAAASILDQGFGAEHAEPAAPMPRRWPASEAFEAGAPITPRVDVPDAVPPAAPGGLASRASTSSSSPSTSLESLVSLVRGLREQLVELQLREGGDEDEEGNGESDGDEDDDDGDWHTEDECDSGGDGRCDPLGADGNVWGASSSSAPRSPPPRASDATGSDPSSRWQHGPARATGMGAAGAAAGSMGAAADGAGASPSDMHHAGSAPGPYGPYTRSGGHQSSVMRPRDFGQPPTYHESSSQGVPAAATPAAWDAQAGFRARPGCAHDRAAPLDQTSPRKSHVSSATRDFGAGDKGPYRARPYSPPSAGPADAAAEAIAAAKLQALRSEEMFSRIKQQLDDLQSSFAQGLGLDTDTGGSGRGASGGGWKRDGAERQREGQPAAGVRMDRARPEDSCTAGASGGGDGSGARRRVVYPADGADCAGFECAGVAPAVAAGGGASWGGAHYAGREEQGRSGST